MGTLPYPVSWGAPGWLALLPLALLPFLRRRRALQLPALPASTNPGFSWLWLPPVFYGFGLLSLIAAAADPRLPARKRLPPPQGHLMIVLDTSASMGTNDAGGRSRLEASAAAVDALLRGLPPLRTGVVRAASEATLALPLTQDGELLNASLADARIEDTERGATALGDAIAVALHHLPEQGPPGALLLISDGRNNFGRLDLATAGAAAAALKIPVFAIGAGEPPAGNVAPEIADDALDEAGLTDLAARTGGRYVRLAAAADLRPALAARFSAPVAHDSAETAPGTRSARGVFLLAGAYAVVLSLLLGWGPLRVYP